MSSSNSISSVTLSPSSVVGGNPSTGTVRLNSAASSATTVNLASSDSSASVPASVTVQVGSVSATFAVSTAGVASTSTSSISATGTDLGNGSAVLTIQPAALTGVSPSVGTVKGGKPLTGTVTLDGSAPTGGTVVAISCNKAEVTLPNSVTIPAGSNQATFNISTASVSSEVAATIYASFNGTTKFDSLFVQPYMPSSVTLNPILVAGTVAAQCTVTIDAPAPASGVVVTMSSDRVAVPVPSSVTVLSGASSVSFTINTAFVTDIVQATVYGTSGGATAYGVLTVTPGYISTFTVNPTSVKGGTGATGTINLYTAAPAGGLTITLTSNRPNVSMPSTVTVPQGQTQVTVPITTTASSGVVEATLYASFAGVTRYTVLTVFPPVLQSLTLNPTSLKGGSTFVATVTLDSPAPVGGTQVSLTSNSGSVTLPATATVPGGSTSIDVTGSTASVTADVFATLYAQLDGRWSWAVLGVRPPFPTSLVLTPSTVTGGATFTAQVTLDAPAPTGGLQIPISSDRSAVSVPSTIFVATGATTGSVTGATSGVSQNVYATLYARFGGVTKWAVLTVAPPSLVSLVLSPSALTGGNGFSAQGTISSPAPAGGLTVNLSSDRAAVGLLSSVTTPGGATSASASGTTTAVGRAGWLGRVVSRAWLAGVSEDLACLVAPGSRQILFGHNSKNGARSKCISELWADRMTWDSSTLSETTANYVYDDGRA